MSGLTAAQRTIRDGIERLHAERGQTPLLLTGDDVSRLAEDTGLTSEQVRLEIAALHRWDVLRAEPNVPHIPLRHSDPILIYPAEE